MSKNINNLNIPEENKILLSKIERRVPFLSKKYSEYFEKTIAVIPEKIEEAYVINENLISILSVNDAMVEGLTNKSFEIRKSHQTDLTREVSLDITNQLEQANLIKSTIEQKDKLVKADRKLEVLSKRKKYIDKRTSKAKFEMNEQIKELEKEIRNENFLDIDLMKEDVSLIKNFIDPAKINKGKWLIYLIMLLILLIIIFTGGAIWIL